MKNEKQAIVIILGILFPDRQGPTKSAYWKKVTSRFGHEGLVSVEIFSFYY
jgi:hypothetical protein